jgi:hypothetical protein
MELIDLRSLEKLIGSNRRKEKKAEADSFVYKFTPPLGLPCGFVVSTSPAEAATRGSSDVGK